ncbi:MAG: dynamin family protein [Leisingera sp.]
MTQETRMHRDDSQPAAAPRKPRLALMGEFSAGKSTLTNLLVGRQPLPVRVTATRLPPVWISHGPEAATITGTDGSETPVPLEDLASVPMETTALIRLTLPAEALELCDLIDMPGISDPNMPASVWQQLLPEVDSVIWCTHATQAWRQSEAAAWEEVSKQVSGPGTLLITHFDKLLSSRDQERVIKRVRKETGDAFDAIFPLSLSQALAADEDMEQWKNSGADAFIEYLVDLLVNWGQPERGPVPLQPADARPKPQTRPEQAPKGEVLEFGGIRESAAAAQAPEQEPMSCAAGGSRVTPRRVTAKKRSPRPERGQPEF